MHAKQYKFSLEDVAIVTGHSISKVYRDVRNHCFDPTSLVSVILYVEESKKKP